MINNNALNLTNSKNLQIQEAQLDNKKNKPKENPTPRNITIKLLKT